MCELIMEPKINNLLNYLLSGYANININFNLAHTLAYHLIVPLKKGNTVNDNIQSVFHNYLYKQQSIKGGIVYAGTYRNSSITGKSTYFIRP